MLYALSLSPFVAALLMALSSGRDTRAALRLSFVLSVVIAAFGICALVQGGSTPVHAWFQLWGTDATIGFGLRADGLSAWLIQLVTLLTPVALLGSHRQVSQRMREYAVAIFVLSGAMINCLLVTDIVLFYVFFEAMLVPTLILVAMFGDEQRKVAGLQFFLYTMFGSIFMLVAIWYLAVHAGTTDLSVLAALLNEGESGVGDNARWWCFLAFVFAFSVKVPLMPLHSWQAPIYASAPTGAVILLSGAMAKIGAYGFLRIVLPMFPDETIASAPCMMIISGIGVVVGALLAIAQTDLKRMLAFSSLSHLSLVIVGIFSLHSAALTGAVIQMMGHGFAIAALFVMVGWLERQFGHRQIDRLGALAQKVPVMAVLFVMAMLSAVAMPGTASFVGEFLLLFGIAQQFPGHLLLVAIIGTSVILGAVYMLRATQKVFYGPAKDDFSHIQAWYKSEAIAVVPMLLCSFYFGLYATPISSSVAEMAKELSYKSSEADAEAEVEIKSPKVSQIQQGEQR